MLHETTTQRTRTLHRPPSHHCAALLVCAQRYFHAGVTAPSCPRDHSLCIAYKALRAHASFPRLATHYSAHARNHLTVFESFSKASQKISTVLLRFHMHLLTRKHACQGEGFHGADSLPMQVKCGAVRMCSHSGLRCRHVDVRVTVQSPKLFNCMDGRFCVEVLQH